MDDLAKRRQRREHDRLLADVGGSGAIAGLAVGDAGSTLAAYDRLHAQAEGHCGGQLCLERAPRLTLGVCGCRCPVCAAVGQEIP
jgi:hypothetical protein